MTRHLINFSETSEVGRWFAINDGVMGGVSTSRLDPLAEDGAAFRGDVSLAHNGGFASIRRQDERWDLGAFDGLEVGIRGDGKRYLLRLKMEPGLDGIVYQARFDSRLGVWGSACLAFVDFAPSFRGRHVAGAPPLDRTSIVSIGFMISDRQAGPFELHLRGVDAVRMRR